MALNNYGLGFVFKADIGQAIGEINKLAQSLMAVQDHAKRTGQALDFRVAGGFARTTKAARELGAAATKVHKDLEVAFAKTGLMKTVPHLSIATNIHASMGANMAAVRDALKEQARLEKEQARAARGSRTAGTAFIGMPSGAVQFTAELEKQEDKLRKQQQALQSLGHSMSSLITKAARYTFLLGLAGAAGIARAAGGRVGFNIPGLSGKYEQELANIRAVTGEDNKAVRDVIAKTAIETQYSPHQIAEAFRHIRISGKDTAESIKLVGAAAHVAQASFGKLTAPKSGEMIAALTKQFALSADEAEAFAAAMIKTQQVSALHIHEMQRVFQHLGVVSMFDKRKGGIGGMAAMTDMLAIAGALRSTGLTPEKAGRYAKSSFVNVFAGKLGKVEALMRAHGKQAVVGKDNELRRPLEVIADLMEIIGNMSTADRAKTAKAIFGKDVIAFANLATFQKQINGHLYKGADALRALAKQYENLNGGAAKQFIEIQLATWEGTKKLLQGSAQFLSESVKMPIQEHLRKVVRPAYEMLNDFLEVLKSREGEMKNFGMALAAGLGGLHFINWMADARHLLFSLIKLPLQFAAALLTLAVAVPVVAALGIGLYGIYVVMQTLGPKLQSMFGNWGEKAKLGFKGLMELMQKGGWSKAVDDEMSKAENSGVRRLTIMAGMFIHRIRKFFEGFADGLDLKTIFAAFGDLGTAIVRFANAIAEMMGFPGTKSFLKMMDGDMWDRGAEAGRSFSQVLVDAIDWITKKLEYLSTAQGKADIQRYWNTAKSVVLGFAQAILFSVYAVLLIARAFEIITSAVGGAKNALWLLIGAWAVLKIVQFGMFLYSLAPLLPVFGALIAKTWALAVATFAAAAPYIAMAAAIGIATIGAIGLIATLKQLKDAHETVRGVQEDIIGQRGRETSELKLRGNRLFTFSGADIHQKDARAIRDAARLGRGYDVDQVDSRSGKVTTVHFSPEQVQMLAKIIADGVERGAYKGIDAAKPNPGWAKPHAAGAST